MASVRHNSTGQMDVTAVVINDRSWEAAHCKFLEAALLERKALAEIEKRRQFMRQCVSEAIDTEDILSRRFTKLEEEKNELNKEFDFENVIDKLLTTLNGPLSLPAMRKSVIDLDRAARASSACMRAGRVSMPTSKTGQETLELELKEVCSLLADRNTTVANTIVASNSARLVDSCLKREIKAITKLKTLAPDVKALTEEDALLMSYASVHRRGASK